MTHRNLSVVLALISLGAACGGQSGPGTGATGGASITGGTTTHGTGGAGGTTNGTGGSGGHMVPSNAGTYIWEFFSSFN
jgi:hypothetical protein